MICKHCKLEIEFRHDYRLIGSNRPIIPKGPLSGDMYLTWCPKLTDGTDYMDKQVGHEPMNESDNVREILNRYEE
jgi:hypothetical protein